MDTGPAEEDNFDEPNNDSDYVEETKAKSKKKNKKKKEKGDVVRNLK